MINQHDSMSVVEMKIYRLRVRFQRTHFSCFVCACCHECLQVQLIYCAIYNLKYGIIRSK